jgi:hypothetical protein
MKGTTSLPKAQSLNAADCKYCYNQLATPAMGGWGLWAAVKVGKGDGTGLSDLI